MKTLKTLYGFGLIACLLSCTAVTADLALTWQQAIKRNDIAVIKSTLARIENVDQATDNGKTALMAAARQGDVALLQTLLARGADINAQNEMGGSVLMYAAASGNAAAMGLLLALGAQVNLQSVNGWTALMMAAVKNHLGQVQQLIDHQANVNLPDIYGWTPLMRAVYENRAAVAQLLLRQPDIDLERQNDHGQTALHVAAIGGRTNLVGLLLQRGARQTADFAGHTPLSIAQTLGHHELSNLLVQ